MILTTYSYITNRNKEEAKNYKGLYFTALMDLPYIKIIFYTICIFIDANLR